MVTGDTLRTDILISIYPLHVANIVARKKNHEFRKYLIPATVTRMWIYETAPISATRYCVVIEPAKTPGELAASDLDGINNRKFNDGETLKPSGSGSRYAYRISELYRLEGSMPLAQLKAKGWAKGPPQKYNYAPREMVLSIKPSLILEFQDYRQQEDFHPVVAAPKTKTAPLTYSNMAQLQ